MFHLVYKSCIVIFSYRSGFSGPLEIRDMQDRLVMCLFPNMPQDMKNSLFGDLAACFDLEPSNLQTMFSGELKERYSFEALHFSYYNRHCTRVVLFPPSDHELLLSLLSSSAQGYNVPEDVHPNLIARADSSRTNYTQMLPYTSADTRIHEDVYRNMGNIFGRMFEWVADQVSFQFVKGITHS